MTDSKCRKPDCHCADIAIMKNGGEDVRDYPCLATPDFEKLKSSPESPSGANVLVEALEKIQGWINSGQSMSTATLINKINMASAKAMAQYNAVEPEKKPEIKKLDRLHELLLGHLDKMNIASQKLFDEKKANPKNKRQGLQDAWNRLAMVLFDSKVTVQTIREIQSSSQSPQTPIPIEPEGKMPLFYIKHLAEGWTGAVLESEKMEDWRLGWLSYDVIDNPNGTDILGGSIAAVEIFQSGKYDYSSSFPIITRK